MLGMDGLVDVSEERDVFRDASQPCTRTFSGSRSAAVDAGLAAGSMSAMTRAERETLSSARVLLAGGVWQGTTITDGFRRLAKHGRDFFSTILEISSLPSSIAAQRSTRSPPRDALG